MKSNLKKIFLSAVILFSSQLYGMHISRLVNKTSSQPAKQFRGYYDDSKRTVIGRTGLHKAQSIEEAKLLIKKGANVNAQDEHGDTPLHLAPAHLVPILVSNGADVTIKNKKIFYIKERQNPDTSLVRTCWEYVPYAYAKEFWKLFQGEKENMEICEGGHYGHREDFIYKGLTPLMFAVARGECRKVIAFQGVVPLEIIKQINPLQLIALRNDFDNKLDNPDRDISEMLYKVLEIWKKENPNTYFLSEVYKILLKK